jgi:hypothetical protein
MPTLTEGQYIRSSRPVWAIQQVPGQTGLHETLEGVGREGHKEGVYVHVCAHKSYGNVI